MSNHALQDDIIVSKINEIAEHINRQHGATVIAPLHFGPFSAPPKTTKEIQYPEYSRSKVDHSTLGG